MFICNATDIEMRSESINKKMLNFEELHQEKIQLGKQSNEKHNREDKTHTNTTQKHSKTNKQDCPTQSSISSVFH